MVVRVNFRGSTFRGTCVRVNRRGQGNMKIMYTRWLMQFQRTLQIATLLCQ